LLSELILQVLLFIFELLLNLGGSALVLFQRLLAVDLGLVDAVMHPLDLGLLLRDGAFVAFNFFNELCDLLV